MKYLTGLLLIALFTPWVVLAPVAATAAEEEEAAIVSLDLVVARVDEGVVLRSELDRRIRSVKVRMKKQALDLPSPEVIEQGVLSELINETIFYQLAQRNGVRTSDDEINRNLSSIAREQNLSIEQFRETIEQGGESFVIFREEMRRQLAISNIQQGFVRNRLTITDEEVNNFLDVNAAGSEKDAQFHLARIFIALPENASQETQQHLSDQVQSIYQKLNEGGNFAQLAMQLSEGANAPKGGELGWFPIKDLPSIYRDSIVTLRPGQFSTPIKASNGYHILQLIEDKGVLRHNVTEYHLSQILIKPSEILTELDAKDKLANLKEQVLHENADFAQLAKTHSEDISTARDGGEMGWQSKQALGSRLASFVDSLKTGDIGEPVRTQEGWTLMYLKDKRDRDDTQEFKQERARSFLAQRKFEDELSLWTQELRSQTFIENLLYAEGNNN